MKTIEQLRAKHALEQIKSVEAENFKKEYKSYVSSLPANILNNGFGQAMAMELSASKGDQKQHKAHKALYEHMQNWLCEATHNPNSPYKDKEYKLIKAIVNNNQSKYIQAQTEAMAYLEWLKKFAVAFLTEKELKKEGE